MPESPVMNALADLPRRIVSALLRGVLLLCGLVFTLALLAAGLVAVLGMVLWGLLRGRGPQMGLYWRMFRAATARRPFTAAGMRRPAGGAQAWRGGARVVDAEVVDVEVREVPPASLPSRR
ncbi:hypothetical protein [Caldimonas tepidiphila]|uniref:hypothetical protein n=1 Tax=Caldimonas tepidiphila TaxID=2315841 RepID=UPI0013007352|nr:hypothetical protein [Caldimonas tepidiphila]